MRSGDPKVVHLSSASSSQGSAEPRNLSDSVILQRLQERGKQRIMTLLYDMFDHVDDALFEMADKSELNAEQNIYFESMREIRIKRRGIEMQFAQGILDSFHGMGDSKLSSAQEPVSLFNATEDSLSIVEDDELEELVAMDGMVSKAMGHYSATLAQLTVRFAELTSKKVDIKTIPLGPSVICNTFVQCCANLVVDIRVKLVVFKLFDKYVISRLDELLEESNQLLINAGVLPKLQSAPHHQSTLKSKIRETLGEACIEEGLQQAVEDEVFSGLRQLLSGAHQGPAYGGSLGGGINGGMGGAQGGGFGTPGSAAGPGAMQGAGGFGGVSAGAGYSGGQGAAFSGAGLLPTGHEPVMPKNLMLDLLSELQYEQNMQISESAGEGSRYGVQVPPQLNIAQLLDGLIASREGTMPHSVASLDNDVLNLVEMLFQFILEDRNLAAPMKALLARIQIPYIKVAVQDQSFFSKASHPARKLLNEIASAAVGWLPPENDAPDALFDKVEGIVERLLNEYTDDSAIFHDILAEFVAFIKVEGRRANLVQQRTVDAEDGRAKTEAARAVVDKVITHKTDGVQLPDVVNSLIKDGWNNVLFLIYLKEGPKSTQWQEALETLDELIWSVDNNNQQVDRAELLRRVPRLLKNLRKGLTKIGYNPFDMNNLFTELEGEHLERLKAVTPDSVQAVATDLPVESKDCDVTIAPGESLSGVKSASVASRAFTADEILDNPLAVTDYCEEVFEEDSVDISDEYLDKVDEISTGDWVEISDGDEAKLRCRLAAIIKPMGRYIFVNRSGRKIAEHKRTELAEKFKEGRINCIDSELLFDRALESVIGNLREMKGTLNS